MKKIITSLAMMSIVASPTLSLINNSQSSMNINFNNNLQVKNNFKNPMGVENLLPDNQGTGVSGIVKGNDGALYTSSSNDMYKSVDGITFQTIPFFDNHFVSAIYVSSQNEIYVASDNGLFKSTDAGNTFSLLTHQLDNFEISSIIEINNMLFASSLDNNKIFKSIDNGKTFTQVGNFQGDVSAIYATPKGELIVVSLTLVYVSSDLTNFQEVKFSNFDVPVSYGFSPDGDFYILTKYGFSNTFNLFCLNKTSGYKTFTKVFSTSSFSLAGSFVFNTEDSIYFVSSINGEIYNINIKTGVFVKMGSIPASSIDNFSIQIYNNSLYTSNSEGLFALNLPYLLLNFGSDYTISADNTFQFNSTQNLGLKWNLLDSITVNGKAVASGTTNLNLTKGNYAISLKLKDQYKNIASDFSGDNNTGIVNYTFSITN